MPRFIALDGEGLTREDGSHDYTLLASSLGNCIEDWSVGGLSTSQCLDYLCQQSIDNAGAVFVGFSFGYDVNMILRDLPRTTLKRLHENTNVDWIPSQGKRYYLKFIPNKWFEVSKQHFNNGKWIRDAYIKVWDVFGFYQSSFIRALEDWKVGGGEQEFIAEMKLRRGKFDEADREIIKRYCWEECRYLVELADLLRESLDDAEIPCKRYHGAGAIADALLAMHNAGDYILQRPNNDLLWDAILRAYFGGRIETFVTGMVSDSVYDYDINSAYPNAIRKLPDLQGAKWHRTLTYAPEAEYAIWRVSWECPEGSRLAPFPYREDSNIYYVRKGEGWYHAPEVRAAYESKFNLTIHEGIICTPANDSRPFSWVEEMYRVRQAAKAAGDKREKVLKLGLNSLYGKFAQATSGKGKPGRFQCFFYAGWITSYCRAMLLRAASQAPDSVLAFATDGILSLTPLELEFGTSIGQWENKTIIEDGLLVIQPGLVISRYESFVRTRGVDRSSIGFDVFYNAWLKSGVAAKVVATDTRFIGLGTALMQSSDTRSLNERWRRWKTHETEISFFPQRKWPTMDLSAWQPEGYCKLQMREGFDGLSAPYQKGLEIDNQDLEVVDYIDSLRIGE